MQERTLVASDKPPPGTEKDPAGFAKCPEGALDKGSGFGTGPDSAQAIVDRAGDKYGCHSCGSKKSGWDSLGEGGHQHWTCDHVPPRSTYKPGTDNHDTGRGGMSNDESSSVRLYPHCRNCAARQGGLMSHMSDDDRETKGAAGMETNQKKQKGPAKPKANRVLKKSTSWCLAASVLRFHPPVPPRLRRGGCMK